MAEDPNSVPIFGNYHLYTAPTGTTMPTELPTSGDTKLETAFKLTGYTTPDGTSLATNKSTDGVKVHQSFFDIRRAVTEFTAQFITTFREWNQQTFEMAFGGGNFSVSSGVSTYTPPDPEEVREFALVADVFDGTKTGRIIMPRTFTSSGVNIPLSQAAPADLPTTFEVLEPGGGVRGFLILGDIPGLLVSA